MKGTPNVFGSLALVFECLHLSDGIADFGSWKQSLYEMDVATVTLGHIGDSVLEL